jgi:hypothetical protein
MSAFWLGYGLSDFDAAVGALIDEVDLCHAPMGLDVSDKHRQKSQTAGAENRSVLSCVVLYVGWHVGSPSPRSAVTSAPKSAYRPRRMPIINSCERTENICAIFAMCGFPVTSGTRARTAFDAIENQPRSNDVMMRRACARCVFGWCEPISTLHGVVFAILGPAQRSTPSGTRRRQCFAPRSEDVRDCDLLLEAGQHADHQDPTADLRGFDRLLHGLSGRPRDRLRSFMPKFQTCTALRTRPALPNTRR